MKKAAKIFLIIGIIAGFWTIVCPIIGIKTVKRINTATSKAELKALGICSIIFVNVLGGIFTLCIPEEALKANAPAVEAPAEEAKAE